MIIKESDLQKGLPKDIQSLCPDCAKIIDGTLVDRDGKVMVEKNCPEHGYFEDIYFSDTGLFHVMEGYAHDGTGVDNPFYTDAKECPTDCGLCQMHLSHTVLANVDLTNRCNLKCPICFANANASGFIVEPSFDEVVEMLAVLRRNSPVATPSVQFAGGEPTVYPYFIEAVKAAHELGFAQIQVATNGVRMAQEPGFTQAMNDAGVHTIYLQFDGFDDEMYKEVRGKPMVDIKRRAVESVRESKPNMSICLVPTLINTVNDDIIGEIVQYAIDNSDVIHAINFQPVAFTGRIDKTELAQKRFTLSDLVHRLVDQTDFLKEEHFFPVPSVSVFSELASVWQNDPKVAFTSHPHCGLATFIFIDEDGTPIPVNEFVDIPRLLADVEKAAANIENSKVKAAAKIKLLKFKLQEGKYINKKKSPGGIGMAELLSAFYEDADKGALADFAWRSMMIGGMHFMDRYNYDVERVKRCTIHYAVPDGRIIPFCAYNSGPVFRDELEKKYAISNEEYRALREKEEVLMAERRRTGRMVSKDVLVTVPAAMEKYVVK
jgi:uncharacterized radical SAM superfamily Fe-S cluster-containing enzyme